MSGSKRQREASAGTSRGLFQESLQVVITAFSRMSWRAAARVAKENGEEGRIGGGRWEAAPESMDVAAWVSEEKRLCREVWKKGDVTANLPTSFQQKLQVLRKEDFDHQYADDVAHGDLWLHPTIDLPSEAVFVALTSVIAQNDEALQLQLSLADQRTLLQIATFGIAHSIAPLVSAAKQYLEPARKRIKFNPAFSAEESAPGSRSPLESAGDAIPENALIDQQHLELPSDGATVEEGTPYPSYVPGAAATTKYIVIRMSDGCRPDGWRSALHVCTRAGVKMYRYQADDLPALLVQLQIDALSPNPDAFEYIREGQEKNYYKRAKDHIIAEAKKLGLHLHVKIIADKKADCLSVLVKTGSVKTYLSGTNDLLFTQAETLQDALETSGVDFDLKTSPVAAHAGGQVIYELLAGSGYSVAPRLALAGDLFSSCTLAFARKVEVNGAKQPQIALYENVSPRLAMKVAFNWQSKVNAFIETDDDNIFGEELMEGWRFLKSKCQPVSRATVEQLLKHQDDSQGS